MMPRYWTCSACGFSWNAKRARRCRACKVARADFKGTIIICQICNTGVTKSGLSKHRKSITCSTLAAAQAAKAEGLLPVCTGVMSVLDKAGVPYRELASSYHRRGWGRGRFDKHLYVQADIAKVTYATEDLWQMELDDVDFAFDDHWEWRHVQTARILKKAVSDPEARACALAARHLGAPFLEFAKILLGEDLLPEKAHE